MSGKPGKQYQEQMELATPKEWQELVPAAILEEVAKEHGGDVKDGKLTAPVHFWILIVGVLCPTCSSLKDLISRFAKRFGSLFGLGQPSGQADEKPWVSPSALSQRNAERPVAFWQRMYQRLREWHFGKGWLRKRWQERFAQIDAIDSSTFRLVQRLRHIFTGCGKYAALKIHQVYNVGGELPEDLGIGPARQHDSKGWRKALQGFKKGVLYLLDRGYCSFKLWWEISDAKSYFITPLKQGIEWEHVRWLNHKRQRERVRDRLIRIPGMARDGEMVLLRLVEILQPDGTWWSYVTNLTDEDLKPDDIAELYSLRWRIEIFFRHLKHTLHMEHFFAQSEAGVMAQLYAAMIAYLLCQVVLLWASREAKLPPEYFRFTTVVHELASWLSSQLVHNLLLPLHQLIFQVRIYAKEIDRRRNPNIANPLPA